jgi:hypothetical protein
MSANRIKLLSILTFAFIFQALFYNHGMGLNTLVFSILTLLLGRLFHKHPESPISKLLVVGFLASTVAVLIGHTHYSFVIYWIVFALLLGAVVVPSIRYVHFIPAIVTSALQQLPASFLKLTPRQNKKLQLGSWLRFVLIPIVLFVVLLGLYAASNTYFSDSITAIVQRISDFFVEVSFGRIFFGLIGLCFALFFSVSQISQQLLDKQSRATPELKRVRKTNLQARGLSRLLLRKQQVAVVFFVLINLMVLWLNILDIKHIWIDFTWDGGYLRDMVREGTYMLIAAILISMGIALYYLNGNLVFMKNHRLFQTLITIWLVQNMLMVISVVFRNTYYIEYFGLAYKRIFVYFFLAACIVGLVSIIYKSIRYKSTTHLLAMNSISVYVLCISAACFNWDAIIARYNFNHYKTSFIHYEFLITLNNASLPYLITDENVLKEVDARQTDRFSFSSSGEYKRINYNESIDKRKQYFKETWSEYSWLDWNWPEARAYELLR